MTQTYILRLDQSYGVPDRTSWVISSVWSGIYTPQISSAYISMSDSSKDANHGVSISNEYLKQLPSLDDAFESGLQDYCLESMLYVLYATLYGL